MRLIIASFVVGSLLACTESDEAPPTQESPPAVDTIVPDTVGPDTVMARDTAVVGSGSSL